MKDSFGREITYARISVTDLCNMRCRYCMPEGVQKKLHDDILSIEQLMAVSDALAVLGVCKQRITGGEPLVRRGIMDLLWHIGNNGNVKTLAVTTNGQLLPDMAVDLKKAGVSAVNISIDTLDRQKYKELTQIAELEGALQGLEAAKKVGFERIKLNAVLLRGVNDGEVKTLADFAKYQKVGLRFIELMPFESQCNFAKQYFIGTNEIVNRYNLQYNAQKSTTLKESFYSFPDGTEISFISPVTNKFCAECNRIRITADGKLLNCLHESNEYNLKPYLVDMDRLIKRVEECVLHKPKEHHLDEGVLQHRNMENIGG